MVEKTAQKPIYLAMEEGNVATAIIRLLRRYPSLETLRVAKPPGQLAVFMVEKEPSIVIVDTNVSPSLIAKAKSRIHNLAVVVVAPRFIVKRLPIDTKSRTQFVSTDCSAGELHTLLDRFLYESGDKLRNSPVSDVINYFSVIDQRGTLDIKNLETGESGSLGFTGGSLVSSEVSELSGPEAVNYMKNWQSCGFRWSQILEGFDETFLDEVSLSLLADASDLVADERGMGLVEATDTSMFPMSFDTSAEFEDVDDFDSKDSFFHNFSASTPVGRFQTGQVSQNLSDKIPDKKFTSPSTEDTHPTTFPKERELQESTKTSFRNRDEDSDVSSHAAGHFSSKQSNTEENKPSVFTPRNDDNVIPNINTENSSTNTSDEPWKHNLSIGALMASNATEILQELTGISGFIAGAVVDSDSGMTLAKLSNSISFDIDVAAATNTEVIKAKLRAAKALKLDDGIEDILITLTGQYHLLRPLEEYPSIFFYIALDRAQANLAMARLKLKTVGGKIKL